MSTRPRGAAACVMPRDRRHERLVPAVDRHALEELDALLLAVRAARAGSRRRARACAAQPRPARRGAAPARSRGAGVERQHAAVAVERDHRIGQTRPAPSRSAARRPELPDARPAAAPTASASPSAVASTATTTAPMPPSAGTAPSTPVSHSQPNAIAAIDSTSRARLSRPSHSSRRAARSACGIVMTVRRSVDAQAVPVRADRRHQRVSLLSPRPARLTASGRRSAAAPARSRAARSARA